MLLTGVIIGLLLAIVCLLTVFRFTPNITRTISKLESLSKTKGKIIEPPNEVIDWIEELPNEAQ